MLAVPVGVEALDDLVHLVPVRSEHAVVTGFGEVLGVPVERLHQRRLAVHHHRLLVRDIEGGIAVGDFDAGRLQRLAGRAVLDLAAAPGRVEHHPRQG
ncbi:MAG: hypothetical protein AW12_01135 [Candidatus Accumulibacter sp. BA-94]|nr:MAG: hypothetical protein AW12_01135 [Candidatus Accumulibacter sp. BA-94]